MKHFLLYLQQWIDIAELSSIQREATQKVKCFCGANEQIISHVVLSILIIFKLSEYYLKASLAIILLLPMNDGTVSSSRNQYEE